MRHTIESILVVLKVGMSFLDVLFLSSLVTWYLESDTSL